jgi:hypothetical protein
LKKIITIALPLILIAGLSFAQATPGGNGKVKFSSVYTNLKTECRSALTKAEEKESERIGEDIPYVCKGYGGYEISLASHGAMTFLSVQLKKGKEGEDNTVASEMMHVNDGIYQRKVEWRLADGVPFAIIFRRDVQNDYADPSEAKKIGEALRVLGLKDKKIDFEVDAKTPNANEEARRLADNAYTSGK